MKLQDIVFRRRFSVNFYGNLQMKLGEMSMHRNWVSCVTGDPYPVLERKGEIREQVDQQEYQTSSQTGGVITRLLGSFFPWATYEFQMETCQKSTAGLLISSPIGQIEIMVNEKSDVFINTPNKTEHFYVSMEFPCKMRIMFRTGGVSVFASKGEVQKLIGDVSLEELDALRKESLFRKTTAAWKVSMKEQGYCCVKHVEWYITAGFSQADIKPIRYENGEPMIEQGKVYLTVTARCMEECYQCVLSWKPSTCEFQLEGVLFFDCGDGYWCSDVASSILYSRERKKWLLWMCAFSHGHVLGHAELDTDPRFGIQVIDVQLMQEKENASLTEFAAVPGDEDPDLLFYKNQWHLTICRLEPETGYHYYHFVSDTSPWEGFSYRDKTCTGEKTGGMFVSVFGSCYFVCGSDFKKRAVYDVYAIDDFTKREKLQCDYDDGGFRGWGTILPLKNGNRSQFLWITFDRHNVSSYNWSYGNLYVYDGDLSNEPER